MQKTLCGRMVILDSVSGLTHWLPGILAHVLAFSFVHAAQAAALPDLIPGELQVPLVVTGAPNPSISYSYSAINQSGADAQGAWWDRLYLSQQPWLDGSEVVVDGWYFSGLLGAAQNYRRTNAVILPLVESGTFYLILSLDDSAALEELDENNNLLMSPFDFSVTPPDLAPIAFQAPAIVTGPPLPAITLVWGITNHGPASAAGSWTDALYISTNGLDWGEGAISFGETGPVPAGGAYWRTNTLRVPVVESGTYYLRFQADVEDALYESDLENNLSAMVAVDFTIFPPDLAPIALQVPNEITGAPHPSVQVVWSVKNQGTGRAAPTQGWWDRIYSSSDPVLDEGDYPAGLFPQAGPVDVGGVYWMTNTVRIAAVQSGTYYLILQLDAFNDLFDSDPANNVLVVPVTVMVLPPDLAPISFVVPPRVEGAANPTVTFRWGITNQGIGPALDLWGDRLYLSSEPVLNLATAKTVFWSVEAEPLESGGSYWRTSSARVPVVESGTYYLILVADADDVMGDADPSNNSLAVPVEFDISVPDLVALDLQAPAVISDSTVTVVWTAGNQGPSPALPETAWTDRLYLSLDPFLDPADVELAARSESGPLSVAGEYSRTNSLSVPAGLDGTYYLIFAANAGNLLYEAVTENNQVAVPVTFVMMQADLAPLVLRIPSQITGAPRPIVTLVWGATNQSSQPAFGSQPWSDNVYFSRSPIRDGNEVWISESRQTVPLAPGSTSWHTNTVRLPATESGAYYFLFQIDGFNAVNELDEENNLIVVPVVLDVRPPDLAPLALQAPEMVAGPPHPMVLLVWGVTNQGLGPAISWSDRVYFSTNAVWDPSDLEVAHTTEAGPVQPGESYWRTNRARVPAVRSGTYYWILEADADASLYETEEGNNTLAVAFAFEVLPSDLAPVILSAPEIVVANLEQPFTPVTLAWGVTSEFTCTNSPMWITDFQATEFSRRFYRIESLPPADTTTSATTRNHRSRKPSR